MWRSVAVCVPLVLVSLAGCNSSAPAQPVTQTSSTASGVAVIDLDAVARALGRDVQMNNAVQQQKQSLESQLEQYQVELQGQLAEQQRAAEQKVGEAPDPSNNQQSSLRSLDQQLTTQLNQAVTNARLALDNKRLQLIKEFRDEVQPIARQVAQERGCSIIVTKNDAVVFAHSPAADISDEVAKRMEHSARVASP